MRQDYLINPETELIPNVGLGEFIEGYSTGFLHFNFWTLLWNFLPIIGNYVFFQYLYTYWKNKINVKRYLIYKEGFVFQIIDNKGRTSVEDIIRFNDVEGISMPKTLHFHNGIYNHTEVHLKVLSKSFELIFEQKSSYENKNEESDKYNICGYAYNAIIQKWNLIAIERFTNSLSTIGHCTFYAERSGFFSDEIDVVELGKDYIKINDDYIEVNSIDDYSFNDGRLFLHSTAEGSFKKNQKKLSVNINLTFNNSALLYAINQLYGIK